jgi:integrase
VDGYRQLLLSLGYTPGSVCNQLAVVGHLGRWMAVRRIAVDRLGRAEIDAFVAESRRGGGRQRVFRSGLLVLRQHLIEVALLRTPDRTRWEGRRDYTFMLVAIQTGLRVSELLGLDCRDVTLGVGAHLRCHGKGRKHRAVPLNEPVEQALRIWLVEQNGQPDEPVFTTRSRRRLSPDAVQRRITLHAANAAARCPSLHGRKLSPHIFRHTSAMNLLHAGVDSTVIALWLGHADVRSTNAYLHADLAIKERALARLAPIGATALRYRPTDKLLAFLEAL